MTSYTSQLRHRSLQADENIFTRFRNPIFLFIANTFMAQWRSGQGVGLATGDRGFDPSRCAVECDLGQVVRTYVPLSPSIVWYQRKLQSEQAHRATHWPRVHGLGSFGWCLAEGQCIGDQRRPMGQVARERTLLTLLLHLFGIKTAINSQQYIIGFTDGNF